MSLLLGQHMNGAAHALEPRYNVALGTIVRHAYMHSRCVSRERTCEVSQASRRSKIDRIGVVSANTLDVRSLMPLCESRATNVRLASPCGEGPSSTRSPTRAETDPSSVETRNPSGPLVSTAETAGAATVSILAIVAPLLCLAGVIAIAVWAVRRLRRSRAV